MSVFNDFLGSTLLGKKQEPQQGGGDDGAGVNGTIISINTLKALEGNEVIGLYFSAHWCPPCRGFTPKLANDYKKLRHEMGKKFEVVFVSSDRDEESFNEYFAEMPWLALPFSERDKKAELSSKYGVQGIPTLVLLDGVTGNIISKNGRTKVENLLEFPWTPKSLQELLGSIFLKGAGDEDDPVETVEVGLDAIKGKVLGLYFSAHWCPPCRGFTPKLADKYASLRDAGKDFEIIFVSSDRDEANFLEYFSEMPWLALPYSNRSAKAGLSEMFEVRGIPALIFLDEDGKLITKNGRGRITQDSYIQDFPFAPKPINDIGNDLDGINSNPSLIVLMEGASEDIQETVEKSLILSAKEEFKVQGPDRIFMFTAKSNEGGPVKMIRKMTSLPPLPPTKHEHPLELNEEGKGWYCDGCNGTTEQRYRCTKGCDFDFCKDCQEKVELIPNSNSPSSIVPLMRILHCPRQGSYAPLSGYEKVTPGNVSKFIADFKAGNLNLNPFPE